MPLIKLQRFQTTLNRRNERYPVVQNGIFSLITGEIDFTLPDGTKGMLQAGDFTLYSSGEISDFQMKTSEGDFSAEALIIDISIFQNFLSQLDDDAFQIKSAQYAYFSKQDICVYRLFMQIRDILDSELTIHPMTLIQLVYALLNEMIAQKPHLLPLIRRAAELSSTQKVIHYIEKNLEQDINIDSAAQSIGMSAATLKRKLASDKISFANILKVKRITKATTELRLTNKAITQIAYDCGFKNAAHFSTAFKAHTELTPKEFRVKIKKCSQIKP